MQRSSRERSPKLLRLVNGRKMTCPRCKHPRDVLDFVPLMTVEEYAHETTPVYKCPGCRWVFAPAEHVAPEGVRVRVA